MTLAEIKQAIFKDSNFQMSFNQQKDLAGLPTEWKQYFYAELRIMLVIHNDVYDAITEAIKAGAPLTNLNVKTSEEVSKENNKPYSKFLIYKYTPAEFTL